MSTTADDSIYTLREDERLRLWRAAQAVTLLSACDNATMMFGALRRDSVAAIARYAAADIEDVLNRVEARHDDARQSKKPAAARQRQAKHRR